MENYIRDKYERKLFITDSSSGSSGPMPLKSSSDERSKKNLIDSEFSDEPNSSSSNTFKTSSSESCNTDFSKKLALLSEMGFTDTDFNYKTLKAANGNMQEALEIIVAANQKQRRKTVDRNIFDEFEEAKPSQSVSQTCFGIDEGSHKESFKSPPSIQLDDWGFNSDSNAKEVKKENAHFSEPDVPIQEDKSNIKQVSSNNPWGNDFVDDSIPPESDSKRTEDPFDTYKAFRSTTSDNYFDNPW